MFILPNMHATVRVVLKPQEPSIPQQRIPHLVVWDSDAGPTAPAHLTDLRDHIDAISKAIVDGSMYGNSWEKFIPRFMFCHGEITSIVIHVLRWRRCDGYVVAQKSDLGIRVIVYLYDNIRHSGGMGTSSLLVNAEELTPDMRKAITKHKSVLRENGFDIPDVLDNAYPDEWFHL